MNSNKTLNIIFPINESIIADQVYANDIFASLKNHPWLEVEFPFQDKIGTIPSKPLSKTNQISPVKIFPDEIIENILLSKGTFQNYLIGYINDLLAKKQSEKFVELSQNYLVNIYYYIAANQWEASQDTKSNCELDIDQDGKVECFLMSGDYFAVIELDGGRLAFLAARSGNLVYQLIGPSSSVMFGLGPEEEWHKTASVYADPQEIPGAFYDDNGSLNDYQAVAISENSIEIFDKITGTSKKFTINEDGLRFEIDAGKFKSIFIPVILSPECMTRNNWQQHYKIYQSDNVSNISLIVSMRLLILIFRLLRLLILLLLLILKNICCCRKTLNILILKDIYFKMGFSLVELQYLPSDRISITISK